MRISALGLAAVCLGGCATTASGPSWRPSEHVARPSEKGDLDEPPPVAVATRDPAPVRETIAAPSMPAEAEEAAPASDPSPRKHRAARRSGHHHRR